MYGGRVLREVQGVGEMVTQGRASGLFSMYSSVYACSYVILRRTNRAGLPAMAQWGSENDLVTTA